MNRHEYIGKNDTKTITFQKRIMKIPNDLINKTISYKTILIIIVLVFALLLFPMLYISKYNVPSADDYSYGIAAHNVIEKGGSAADILKAVIDQVRYYYNNWQGTFTGVFMASLPPAVFGEKYYVLVPYIMLIPLISGIFYLIITFFSLFSDKKK